MNTQKFSEAMGEIDTKYIEKSANYQPKRKKHSWVKWASIAACFCLIALIGFGIWHNGMLPSVDPVEGNQQQTIQSISDYEQEVEQIEIECSDSSMSTPTRTDHLAKDILLEAQLQGVNSGVAVPIFIAYNGAIYGGTDYDMTNAYVSVSETEIEFNPDYTYTAYQVTDHPELVAIIINGGYMVYEKMFEVMVKLDGKIYQVECPVIYLTMDAVGKQILEADGIKVYEAIDVDSQDTIGGKCIVDITELMSAYSPNLFSDSTTIHVDCWWVAQQVAE